MVERRIETDIDINAPAARVWALLTDFARMPSWNPFIKSISGNLAQGARLSVHIAPPGSSGMRFKPTILSIRPERELCWLGHPFVSGIFDGEPLLSAQTYRGVPDAPNARRKILWPSGRPLEQHVSRDECRLQSHEYGPQAAG
jgi:hypothetical protein